MLISKQSFNTILQLHIEQNLFLQKLPLRSFLCSNSKYDNSIKNPPQYFILSEIFIDTKGSI